MTKECKLRMTLDNLIDTAILLNDKARDDKKMVREWNLDRTNTYKQIMNVNMDYIEDLDNAIDYTLTRIKQIMKEALD